MDHGDAVDEEQGYYAPGTYGERLSVACCAYQGCERVRRPGKPEDLQGWGTLRFILLTGSDVPGKRTVASKLAFCPDHFTSVLLAHKVWFDEATKKQREIE